MSKYEKTDTIKEGTSRDKILKLIKNGSKVLEFGPDYGIMTRYLKEELNCEVFIVECNSDSFAQAMTYATGGFCGDIEAYEWNFDLEDESFDYIIFADVLEHLHNPGKVLEYVKRFLCLKGHVLISVPNMAHADIIMNLFNNMLNYTIWGLLDSTHIHFFAYKSLLDLIKASGYTTVNENCTLKPAFCSEQGSFIPQERRLEFSGFINRQQLGNVYQFVMDLQKTEYVQNHITLSAQTLNEQAKYWSGARVYFDDGSGFSKDSFALARREGFGNAIIYNVDKIPAGTRQIRFDPLNRKSYYVYGMEIMGSEGLLEYRPLNGEVTSFGEMLFLGSNPQILILNTLKTTYLEIRYYAFEFIDFEHKNLMKNYIDVTAEKDAALSTQHRIRTELTQEREETVRVMTQEMAQEREEMAQERKEMMQIVANKTAEINALNTAIAEKNATINELKTSTSWKITKPIRFVGRLFRGGS